MGGEGVSLNRISQYSTIIILLWREIMFNFIFRFWATNRDSQSEGCCRNGFMGKFSPLISLHPKNPDQEWKERQQEDHLQQHHHRVHSIPGNSKYFNIRKTGLIGNIWIALSTDFGWLMVELLKNAQWTDRSPKYSIYVEKIYWQAAAELEPFSLNGRA